MYVKCNRYYKTQRSMNNDLKMLNISRMTLNKLEIKPLSEGSKYYSCIHVPTTCTQRNGCL